MARNRISLFFLSLALCLTFRGYSQEGTFVEIRDLETWTSAELKLKVKKKWNFGIQSQLRLDQNSSELKSYLSQLSIAHKFTKKFQIGMNLRHTVANDNSGEIQGTDYYFRIDFETSFKHKIKRFELKHRFRYTSSNEIGVAKIDGDFPEQYFRLKSSVDYNIKDWKLDPELSAEIFSRYIKYSQFNGPDYFRLTFGTTYKLKSIGNIGLNYRLEREIGNSYPKTTNILQFKYTYTIKL